MNDYKELIDELRCYAYAADDLIYGICVNSPKVMFQAADAIEQLVKEYEELDELNDAVCSEYRKVKKERDAAVADLEKLMHTYSGTVCFYCKHYNDRHCDDCVLGDKWQWRGVGGG